MKTTEPVYNGLPIATDQRLLDGPASGGLKVGMTRAVEMTNLQAKRFIAIIVNYLKSIGFFAGGLQRISEMQFRRLMSLVVSYLNSIGVVRSESLRKFKTDPSEFTPRKTPPARKMTTAVADQRDHLEDVEDAATGRKKD